MHPLTKIATSLVVLSIAACANLEPRPPLPAQSAVPVGATTALDEAVGAREELHPGASGFRLLREGEEAFAVRAHSAVLAGRSLDVQTYIWHSDLTGRFLAASLLQAADRGVKVRLLIDDMDARSRNYGFAALHAHPNIEVRMFNPFATRGGTVRLAFEALGSFRRINHRMHNKTWIADNRIAIVGGRNLGDEYFGASDEVNFVDLDFAMVGPIVRDASASFDRYWNSPLAYPMDALSPDDVSEAHLQTLRGQLKPAIEEAKQSRYAGELQRNDTIKRLVAGDLPMNWSTNYRFVSDDPLKAAGQTSDAGNSEVLALLGPVLHASRQHAWIISPYFVPGKEGTANLVSIARNGSDVRVLTNSLAANDVAMVYGGYSKWRKPLLEGGVKIWELKPAPGKTVDSSMFGSSDASLHTKALTVDGRLTFVGSYNLDPRSTSLNSEQGVFVEDTTIAAQLEEITRQDTGGDRAWSVMLEDGELQWSDGTETLDSTPEASFGRKFQAWLARVFPVSSQL
jgi:putative cardiolipin synthase